MFVSLLGLALAASPSAAYAEVIVVRTDGARIAADALAPSSRERLAFRHERPGIVLTRFIDWDDVAEVLVDGRAVPIESLRGDHALTEPVSLTASTRIQPVARVEPISPPVRLMPASAPPVFSSGAEFGCGVAPLFQVPRHPHAVPPAGTRAVVVGVTDNPLAAYADLLGGAYPAGVPASEAGFALGVLRATRAQQLLGPPIVAPVPVAPVPAAPVPAFPIEPPPLPAP